MLWTKKLGKIKHVCIFEMLGVKAIKTWTTKVPIFEGGVERMFNIEFRVVIT
jgi:hypothetical protein